MKLSCTILEQTLRPLQQWYFPMGLTLAVVIFNHGLDSPEAPCSLTSAPIWGCRHSPLRLWWRCSWRRKWRCQLVVIVQWQLALWWTRGGSSPSSPSSRGSLGWALTLQGTPVAAKRSQGLGLWLLCLEQWNDLCSCGAKGQSWKRSRTPEECSRSLWPVYWMSYLRDIYWFIGSFTHCTALDSQNFGIRWIVKVVKSFQLSELSRPVIQSCKGNQEDCPGPGFHELTALQSQSAWGELSGPSCAMLQMFRGWECASSQKYCASCFKSFERLVIEVVARRPWRLLSIARIKAELFLSWMVSPFRLGFTTLEVHAVSWCWKS